MVGGAVLGACFHSDFVLYGPRCALDLEGKDCADVVADRDDHVCFSPSAAAEYGYCSVYCNQGDPGSCKAQGGLEPRCIGWETADDRVVGVCTLVCGEGRDCPEGMECRPDPAGGESSICFP